MVHWSHYKNAFLPESVQTLCRLGTYLFVIQMKYGGMMNIKMKISEIDQPLSISLILYFTYSTGMAANRTKKVIKKMTEIIELIYIV